MLDFSRLTLTRKPVQVVLVSLALMLGAGGLPAVGVVAPVVVPDGDVVQSTGEGLAAEPKVTLDEAVAVPDAVGADVGEGYFGGQSDPGVSFEEGTLPPEVLAEIESAEAAVPPAGAVVRIIPTYTNSLSEITQEKLNVTKQMMEQALVRWDQWTEGVVRASVVQPSVSDGVKLPGGIDPCSTNDVASVLRPEGAENVFYLVRLPYGCTPRGGMLKVRGGCGWMGTE